MTKSEFDRVLSRRLGKIERVLGIKAEEYSSAEDRLHNFKRGAAMLQITPEAHCIYLMSKHLISILDMVDNVTQRPPNVCAWEKWDEKVGDAINYLVLLEALVWERLDQPWDESYHGLEVVRKGAAV